MTDDNQTWAQRLAAPTDDNLTLSGFDPGLTFIGKSDAADGLDDMRDDLFDLHELMMANEDRAVLLVLQGLDCSGKNGTIKHVIDAMNPAAIHVASFLKPTGDEKDEHFLDRIKRKVPGPGQLTVFDRSHYEDVFVPAVKDGMSGDQFDERIGEIIEFEQQLVDDGVTIIKCLLHISYDEQRERFLRRLRRHDKRWKFSEADIDTRMKWDEWQVVYGKAIGRSSTEDAPWYVIPSDKKWHRNWTIAKLLVEQFEAFGEEYPEPFTDDEIEAFRARLEPPS